MIRILSQNYTVDSRDNTKVELRQAKQQYWDGCCDDGSIVNNFNAASSSYKTSIEEASASSTSRQLALVWSERAFQPHKTHQRAQKNSVCLQFCQQQCTRSKKELDMWLSRAKQHPRMAHRHTSERRAYPHPTMSLMPVLKS